MAATGTPGTTTTELKVIKTLWGIEEPISVKLFQSIQKEGYHGVECIRLAWSNGDSTCTTTNDDDPTTTTTTNTTIRDNLVQALNVSGLALVCQMHTSGGYIDHHTSGSGAGADYVYCGSYDVKVHQEDFTKQLQECVEVLRLVQHGGFINVHAGVDAWSKEEMVDFLTYCFREIEKYCCSSTTCTGTDDNDDDDDDDTIMVTFETHRQRIFGTPFQTRELLSIPRVANSKYMKFNADLSHWYVACERVFDSKNEARDTIWWPKLLAVVAERCNYIHARFGHAQGPQLADPSASHCTHDCTLQIEIWKVLLQAQYERKKKEDRKQEYSY